MTAYNQQAIKEFGLTGKSEIYRLSKSIYGWQIRERTGYDEHTIFRSEGHSKESYGICLAEIQKYIDAGYGVIVYDFEA